MASNIYSQSTPTLSLLKPNEAADALGICPRTLWAITAPRGTLSCVRVGKSVRYHQADLDDFIEQHKSKGGQA